MPSFIEKLALAFLEYKTKTKGAWKEQHPSSPQPQHVSSPSAAAVAATDHAANGFASTPQLPSEQEAGDPGSGLQLERPHIGSTGFRKDSLATYLDWLNVQKPESRLIKSLPTMTDALLLLRCEHWLEAADATHRYGSNLRPYFDHWVTHINNRIEEGDEDEAEREEDGSWLDQLMNDGRGGAQGYDDGDENVVGAHHAAAAGTSGRAAERGGNEDEAGNRNGGRAGPGAGAAGDSRDGHAVLGNGWCAAAVGQAGPGGSGRQKERSTIPGADAPLKDKSKEPAGGWQKVLEAVAASTILHRRSAGKPRVPPASVPLTRKSSFASLSRGSGAKPPRGGCPAGSGGSAVGAAALLQSRSGREVASAPATPKTMSRCPSGRKGGAAAGMEEGGHCSGPQLPGEGGEGGGYLRVGSLGSLHAAEWGVGTEGIAEQGSPRSGGEEGSRGEGGGPEEEGVGSVSGEEGVADVQEAALSAAVQQQQEQQQRQKRWMLQSKSLRLVALPAAGEGESDGEGDGLVGDSDEDDEGGPLNLGSLDEVEDGGGFNLHEDQDRNNFFLWLDEGEGKHLDLASLGVPREKLERERVRYLTPEELAHYEVVVDKETGLLKYNLSGHILHTFGPADKDKGKDKEKERGAEPGGSKQESAPEREGAAAGSGRPVDPQPTRGGGAGAGSSTPAAGPGPSPGPGPDGPPCPSPPEHHGADGPAVAGPGPGLEASAGTGTAGLSPGPGPRGPAVAGLGPGPEAGAGIGAAGAPPCPIPPEHHGAKKWIWVVAPSGQLYVAPKIRGAFHHSSFLRGAVVMAAGNMVVDHGKLVKLTADSGHYWPQPDHFRWFFEHLSAQGADMTALQGMDFKTKH